MKLIKTILLVETEMSLMGGFTAEADLKKTSDIALLEALCKAAPKGP